MQNNINLTKKNIHFMVFLFKSVFYSKARYDCIEHVVAGVYKIKFSTHKSKQDV